ncbi:MAG TPA: hypothetical protein VEY51_12165 [Chondromyces sp.]|nr:hypothetical protein [Chondromyces sp.]
MSSMLTDNYMDRINYFRNNLPYKNEPFSKKNWGHNWHSLCSYQGKLKPAIAHWLIELFTEEGQKVLDPLGGSGTIAFEACLQGRFGITNDLSPFAATIGASKVSPPTKEEVDNALLNLAENITNLQLTKEDYESAEFGLNSPVKDYYHPQTLDEILKIRKYFLTYWSWEPAQNFLRANMLHILHGNRPYALSRKSHSLTPYKPSGEFEYRPALEKLKERIDRIFQYDLPFDFQHGSFYHSNTLELGSYLSDIDIIITSPPFVGMRFDRPNWLRLWFCGWGANDFHNTSLDFLERKQSKNWDIYLDFFEMCNTVLKSRGNMILHLGKSEKYDMVSELINRSAHYFNTISIITEDVSNTDHHGITDKGTTNEHLFLFLQKKT